MSKTGFCRTLFQILLTILNAIFFLIGAAIFVAGALIKWSNFTQELTDLLERSIPNGTIFVRYLANFFLIFGAVIIVISLAGMIGACFSSRTFLIFYVLSICIILVVHLGAFVAILVRRSDFEKVVKEAITKIAENLGEKMLEKLNNINDTDLLSKDHVFDEVAKSCKEYRYVATLFQCCDIDSASDLKRLCCPSGAKDTFCSNKVYSFVSNYLMILPNSCLISFEFALIAEVVYIIVRLSSYVPQIYARYE
jgi:hypothetical protein